jgi:hypothetical protein
LSKNENFFFSVASKCVCVRCVWCGV